MIAKIAVSAANFAIDKPYSYFVPLGMELLPGMPEIKPKNETWWERLFKKEEPFLLDGADSSTLSLDWKTEEGTVSVSYHWKHDDPKAEQLIELLYALQENSKGA